MRVAKNLDTNCGIVEEVRIEPCIHKEAILKTKWRVCVSKEYIYDASMVCTKEDEVEMMKKAKKAKTAKKVKVKK